MTQLRDGSLINSLLNAFFVTCQGVDKKLQVPQLGSLLLRVPLGCSVFFRVGMDERYPVVHEGNTTTVEVLLPITWAKEPEVATCANEAECFADDVFRPPVASAAVGVIVASPTKRRVHRGFQWGEVRRETTQDYKVDSLEEIRASCMSFMGIQLGTLVFTILVLVAVRRYRCLGTLVYLLLLVQSSVGSGDVQVGPDTLIPRTGLPEVEVDLGNPRVFLAVVVAVGVVAVGVSLGVCCCMAHCGKR
jgi:hypothetical protein